MVKAGELRQLLEDLPEEDVDWLVRELRKRAAVKGARQAVLQGRAWDAVLPSTADSIDNAVDAELRRVDLSKVWVNPSAGPGLRWALQWPELGPATIGTSVLLGWGAGVLGGPLIAVVGALVGLVIGDQLDRRRHVSPTADT